MQHSAHRVFGKLLAIASILLAWTSLPASAESAKTKTAAKADTYPLTTCPVTGAKLGSMGDPVIKSYDGREVRFCCGGCPAKFEKDLPGNLKKLDAAFIKAQLPTYPLTTCVVSGDKLGGDMGKPVDYLYKGQLVRLCCKGCIKKFEKDPKQYLAKIAEAQKAKKSAKPSADQSTDPHADHGDMMQSQESHDAHAGHGAHGH